MEKNGKINEFSKTIKEQSNKNLRDLLHKKNAKLTELIEKSVVKEKEIKKNDSNNYKSKYNQLMMFTQQMMNDDYVNHNNKDKENNESSLISKDFIETLKKKKNEELLKIQSKYQTQTVINRENLHNIKDDLIEIAEKFDDKEYVPLDFAELSISQAFEENRKIIQQCADLHEQIITSEFQIKILNEEKKNFLKKNDKNSKNQNILANYIEQDDSKSPSFDYLDQIRELNKKIQNLEKMNSITDEENIELLAAIKEKEKQIIQLQSEFEKNELEMEKKSKENLTLQLELKEIKSSIKAAFSIFDYEIKNYNDELSKTMLDLRDQFRNMEEKIQMIPQLKKEIENKNNLYENEKQKYNEISSKLNDIFIKKEEEIKNLVKKVTEYEFYKNNFDTERKKVESLAKTLEETKEDYLRQIKKLEETTNELSNSLNSEKNQCSLFKSQLDQKNIENKNNETEILNYKKEIESLKLNLHSLTTKSEQNENLLNSQIKQLKEKLTEFEKNKDSVNKRIKTFNLVRILETKYNETNNSLQLFKNHIISLYRQCFPRGHSLHEDQMINEISSQFDINKQKLIILDKTEKEKDELKKELENLKREKEKLEDMNNLFRTKLVNDTKNVSDENQSNIIINTLRKDSSSNLAFSEAIFRYIKKLKLKYFIDLFEMKANYEKELAEILDSNNPSLKERINLIENEIKIIRKSFNDLSQKMENRLKLVISFEKVSELIDTSVKFIEGAAEFTLSGFSNSLINDKDYLKIPIGTYNVLLDNVSDYINRSINELANFRNVVLTPNEKVKSAIKYIEKYTTVDYDFFK